MCCGVVSSLSLDLTYDLMGDLLSGSAAFFDVEGGEEHVDCWIYLLKVGDADADADDAMMF